MKNTNIKENSVVSSSLNKEDSVHLAREWSLAVEDAWGGRPGRGQVTAILENNGLWTSYVRAGRFALLLTAFPSPQGDGEVVLSGYFVDMCPESPRRPGEIISPLPGTRVAADTVRSSHWIENLADKERLAEALRHIARNALPSFSQFLDNWLPRP